MNGQASQYVEQSVRAGRGRVGHQKMLLIKAYIEDCGRRFLVVAHAEQAESEKQQIPCTAFSTPISSESPALRTMLMIYWKIEQTIQYTADS